MRQVCLGLTILSVLAASERPEWWPQPEGDAWKQAPQVFAFNNGAEPQSLDPAIMTGVLESRLGIALYEGLVGLHPQTLAPVPACAKSWDISADGLTYTFHLVPGLTWSNGESLSADDFQGSWLRALEPATASEYAYQLYPIRGAEAFNKTSGGDPATVGLAVPDPLTLVVTLHQPCAYFLDLVAFHTLFPVHLPTLRAHGAAWTQVQHFVGNGPFMLAEWQPRNRIRMVRNPRWRDAGHMVLQEVIAYAIEDQDTGVKMFQTGELHWQPAVPSGRVQELRLDPDYYVEPYLGTYFYRFNVTRAPGDDVRVRKALCLALDRRVITEHILGAGQQPSATLCPRGCAGYEPVAGLPYDREAARQLWAQTPYGRGEQPLPPIELLFNTSEDHKKIAENVVAQWRENLGIAVSLRNMEWKVYLEHMTKLDYQVMRASWIGDYNDPNTFFDMFVTDGGNNRTGWSHTEYDRLLGEAAASRDHAQRLAIFQRMERILVEDECPILPVYTYVNQGLLKEAVGGFQPNLRDHHAYQYLWMDW